MGANVTTAGIQVAQMPLMLTTLGLDKIVWPPQATPINNSAFDYILVGGGTSGSVVATRLVEDKKNTVLLLESGSDPPISALIAALFVTLPKSSVDYNYMSTFNPYSASGQGNYTTLTAGDMLGGCASLNHFIWTRGCPDDLDDWANITGDDSFKYHNFLKYFIKSERVDDKEIIDTYPNVHGTDGPTGLTREIRNKADKYLESFAEINIPTVLDLNSGNTSTGFTFPQVMIDNKIRQTPAVTYLGEVKNNPNLYVSKYTRVVRVVFENNTAVAVVAIYKGITYVFRANKEIILCAGVFNSPQILMLSGIGEKEHLNEVGIEDISDLPVGNDFTDQVATTLVYKTKKKSLFGIDLPNPLDLATDPTKIPFPLITGSVALDRTDTCPNYQVYSLVLAHDTPFLTLACRDTFWYRSDICNSWQKDVEGSDSLYSVIANVIPKSRGMVRLNTTNPLGDPVITTNYFKDKEDLDNMVKFVKDFIKVGGTSYFKEVNAELVGVDLPECKDIEYGSDDFWSCYILHRAISPYHYTGTCPIGKVIDNSFKLIGFKRIRVIDASSIPRTPRSAPVAIVIALAEKGAEAIKSEPYY